MADSVREQIVQNLTDAIRQVKTANGYQNNIADENIKRGKTTPVDVLNEVPGVFIYQDSDPVAEREYGAVPQVYRDLGLLLEIWQTATEVQLDTKINELEGEIILAIMQDPTRGGKALYTEVEGSETFYLEGEKRIGGSIVTITIRYGHAAGNPFES
jgi:hypothetical protein